MARGMILVRLQERTAEDWMARFRANGNVAAEPFITTAEALYHPDLVADGDIVTIDDPVRGPVRTIGPVAELTQTPARIGRPAPEPGQQTAEVVAELAERPSVPVSPMTGGPATVTAPASGRPLEGITVVEFATIIAAPLSTVMLADLGARVIKVESVDGDPYRHLRPDGSMAAKAPQRGSSPSVST